MRASFVNKYHSVVAAISFAVVLLLALLFVFLFIRFGMQDIPENYVETEATITRIERELKPDALFDKRESDLTEEDYDHRVFVEYSYGGNTYAEKEYNRYDSSMDEGDKVLLYLNPDAPAEFMCDPSGDFIFLIIGIVFAIIGAGGLGYQIYTAIQRKKRGNA